MRPRREESKARNELRPSVDEGRCLGCGVCVDECPRDAMTLARREKPPYVPLNGIEKALRQSLERGRLADLLFDAGAGQGPRMLNLVVKALASLPPVDRVLASEQVRSRFIRYALGSVPEPY
jgi:ferredoxin